MNNKLVLWIIALVFLVATVQGGTEDDLIYWFEQDEGSGGLTDSHSGFTIAEVGTVPNQSGLNDGTDWGRGAYAAGQCFLNSSQYQGLTSDGNFTLMAWIRYDGALSAYEWIVQSYGGAGTLTYYISRIDPGEADVMRFTVVKQGEGEQQSTFPTPSFVTGAWYQIVGTYNNSVSTIYINGTAGTPASDLGGSYVQGAGRMTIGSHDGINLHPAEGFYTDKVALWNRTLDYTEIIALRDNQCTYANLSSCESAPPPPVFDYINLSTPLPENESSFNALPVFFNVSANISLASDCSLWINDTLNQTQSGISGVDVSVEFNISNLSKGVYTYFIGCNTTNSSENTTAFEFIFDLLSPVIVTDLLNNSVYWNKNITATINITDDVLIHTVNISLDGTTLFNTSHVHDSFFQYNLSLNATNYSVGLHVITIYAADGHTSKALKDAKDYNPKTGYDLVYDIKGEYKKTYIKMYDKRGRKGDLWEVIEKSDRYLEVYEPSVPEESMTFVIESDREIYFAQAGDMYGGGWLIIGNHWKDFVLKNEPTAVLSFSKKNKRKYEVTISGLKHPERLEFSSTGDLNINEVNYTFYVGNLSERYTNFILSGFTTTFYLDMLWNLSGLNTSAYSPVAILEWNGTNYTATQDIYNATQANFSYVLSVPYTPIGTYSVPHNWFFNYSDLSQGYFETSVQYQNQTNITIGECDTWNVYPVLNISYLDEVTDDPINITGNNYDLAVWDGTYWYNITGSFNGENSSALCTNINSANASYNWNVWGTFSMSAPSYISRIHTIVEATPLLVSNDPLTELDLFMIRTNYSTTVTFTWLTKNFQQFDGTMNIYRCNNDSTRSLVDSQTIINGIAYANIQLFFTSYSYEVIIEGVTYTDAWTTCHIEAATERELLVDLDEIVILPVIGLFMVDCSLTNLSNNVTMTWSANPEDTTTMEACIVGKRQTIYNLTEVYRNCSNQTSGSFSVTVPSLSNEYTVTGEITQNGYKGYCRDALVFNHDRTDVSSALGATGLIAIVILIMSLVLMYAGEGEKQVIASVVGVIIAFFIGLTSVAWPIISAMAFLGAIVIIVGRYTKYGSVF